MSEMLSRAAQLCHIRVILVGREEKRQQRSKKAVFRAGAEKRCYYRDRWSSIWRFASY
jgi:hypothetical protein